MAGIYVQFLKGNKPSDYSKCDFFSATCFWLFLLYMYVFLTLYWDNFRLGEQSQREQTVTQLSQLPTMLTAQRNTTQGSQWENTTAATEVTDVACFSPAFHQRLIQDQPRTPSAFSRHVSSASSGLWRFPWSSLVFHDLGNVRRLPVRHLLERPSVRCLIVWESTDLGGIPQRWCDFLISTLYPLPVMLTLTFWLRSCLRDSPLWHH